MLKELVTPHAANVFVGKLGDILEKAVDKPLGLHLAGDGCGLCGRCN